ncbi:MAG: bifunctional phosphopantothenoylcysteine decarboxylase/phosphopantothenate--cysteine ligase CoaBC [Methanomassiliicoccales archaeon]|jgi:phosphopantothenoylcysteine decarboxylase/phosphopantothenate--cysteine ligase|nr:bifunctional phosphopantothenoylcysteine decarboxylase/phosphopantothenate--cysteine ligase CoaBC [Methanomassiliicoccales archaeon]
MHPSESIWGTKSKSLAGKKIILGVTGSIAAVESLELARELIRHGAQVRAVMTPESLKIITQHTMEFATGQPVITNIGGQVEHVSLLGDFPDRADLLLIAPCTANTISKIAAGIDDTPVTTMATTAVGSGVPIMIAPAMHISMYRHPIVQKNIKTLTEYGIEFIDPYIEGKKAKLASVEEITERVIRRLGPRDFLGKRILIIGGSSAEPIDDMRIITNRGTGETAVQIALAAFERSADVELWMGRSSVTIPEFIRTKRFETLADLLEMVGEIDQDIVLVPAALSDYTVEKTEGKIPSDKEELVLHLRRAPKVLESIRKKKCVLFGFKAESSVTADELVARARSRMIEFELDGIVANDLREVSKGTTKVTIMTKKGTICTVAGSKKEVAHRILDEVLRYIT